jgi:hypothetical protein
MGEGIHAGDREAEVRVELVGNPKRIGLNSQAKKAAIAVVTILRIEDREAFQVT